MKLAVVTDQPPLLGWPALPLCLKVYLGATCTNSLLLQAVMHMQLWYSCETCGRNWPTTTSRLTCFASVCLFVHVHCAVILSLLKCTWKIHLQLISDIMQLEYMQHNPLQCIKYWQDVQTRAPLGSCINFLKVPAPQIHICNTLFCSVWRYWPDVQNRVHLGLLQPIPKIYTHWYPYCVSTSACMGHM